MQTETIAEQLSIKDFPFEIKDKNGNKIYYEDSDGFWEKTEYDENGNKIYYEDSDGFWEKTEYDENGNKVYDEDSNGFWHERSYDSDGWEIYLKNSDKYWHKSEYDEKKNEIYHENSDGFWRKYEYDAKGREIYYKNSEGVIRDNRHVELSMNKIKSSKRRIPNDSEIKNLKESIHISAKINQLFDKLCQISEENKNYAFVGPKSVLKDLKKNLKRLINEN